MNVRIHLMMSLFLQSFCARGTSVNQNIRTNHAECSDINVMKTEDRITFTATQDIRFNISLADNNVILSQYKVFNRSAKAAVEFRNLRPGWKYEYQVHPLGDGNANRSEQRICNGTAYTNPKGPSKCETEFTTKTVKAMSLLGTLPRGTTTTYVKNYLLVISNGSITKEYSIPFTESTYEIRNLTPDMLYTMTLHNAIILKNGRKVLSKERCTLNEWTRPALDCSAVKWLTPRSFRRQVILPNVRYKLAVFVLTDDSTNKSVIHTKPASNYAYYTFQLARGNSYTLDVYVVGQGNYTSEPLCVKKGTFVRK